MPSIELNGEGEPVWLTPHLRDPQPEGERERASHSMMLLVGLDLAKGQSRFDLLASFQAKNSPSFIVLMWVS